jgi:transposase
LAARAQIILAANGDYRSHTAEGFHVTGVMGYSWIKRFHADGIDGLYNRPRSGRPATYPADAVTIIIATALTKPQKLQLAFGSWTLDRLETYVNQQKGIGIKRSHIDDILIAEGLRWRTQETWFGQQVDPDFAEKRDALKRSTQHHQRRVSSSASMNWDRRQPRAPAGRRWCGRAARTVRMERHNHPAVRSRRSTTDAGVKAMGLGPSDR